MKVNGLCIGVVVCLAISGVAADYELIDLGTMGEGYLSIAKSINDSGTVAGYASVSASSSGDYRAFYWDSSSGMTEIGSAGSDRSTAHAINNQGYVTGSYQSEAYIWHPDTGFTFLEDKIGSSYHSAGMDINDNNHVVGTMVDKSALQWIYEGAYWADGTLTVLQSESTYHYAKPRAINNSDKIVGSIEYPGYGYQGRTSRAVLWKTDGSFSYLSDNSDEYNFAYDINDDNIIIGGSKLNDEFQACYWDDNLDIQYIGSIESGFDSSAYSINNYGVIVGSSAVSESYFDEHGWEVGFSPIYSLAFIWDELNGMVDLNTLIPEGSGFEYLVTALDINEQGQIVGYGMVESEPEIYEKHAFLLSPVPEPTSLLLLCQFAG